jgi:hypothetical protein
MDGPDEDSGGGGRVGGNASRSHEHHASNPDSTLEPADETTLRLQEQPRVDEEADGGVGAGERVGGKRRLGGQGLDSAARAPVGDSALQPASEEVLRQLARRAAEEKAALLERAEAAGARVLELQREAGEARAQQEAATREAAQAREAAAREAAQAEARMLEVQREARALQQRAEAAEERVLELQRELAPGVPALMRAAAGVGAVVAGMERRELRALDGAWAAAAETIRAERTQRAQQMPDRFLCPISQALPLPPR